MKKFRYTALALAALLLTSCSTPPTDEPLGDDDEGIVRDVDRADGYDSSGFDADDFDLSPPFDRGVIRDGPEDPGVEPDDGGSSVEDVDADTERPIEETCETVCFEPSERVEWDPGTDYPFTPSDECNRSGAERGVCPDNFFCGREETVPAGITTRTILVCESASGSPYRLDIDVPLPTPLADPVPVLFRFHVNGGDWPAGDPDEYAGIVAISRADSRGTIITAPIPTVTPGELVLQMEPGVHSASFIFYGSGGGDDPHYPSLSIAGKLVVRAEGEVDIWVEGTPFSFDVTLDGVPIEALGATETVLVSFRGFHSQNPAMLFSAGDRPASTLILEPDTYRVEVTTTATAIDSTLPLGMRVIDTALAVPSGSTRNERFNLESVLVSGTVGVDGSVLPAASNSGAVVFESETATLSVPLSATRPASFSRRILKGTYDVYYVPPGRAHMPGLPETAGIARKGYVAGPTLELNLTTVDVSGEITLNSATLPDRISNRGYVWFETPGAEKASFSLDSTGPGNYSGRVFAGDYTITVQGTGSPLPNVAWPVADFHTVTATRRVLNVNAASLTVTLTHNGIAPPENPGGSYGDRGSLIMVGHPFPDVTTSEVSRAFPNVGTMSTSLVLPAGEWTLSYDHETGDYMGIPFGARELGAITVSGEVTGNYDLPSIDVIGTLTRDGASTPSADTGFNRGTVKFDVAGLLGFRIPGFGAADYSGHLFPGIYQVVYECLGSLECDTSIGPKAMTAYSGIALD